MSRRNREERNIQSMEAFPGIGFVTSCFCPITTLIEPSIIPSPCILSPEEARHKMLPTKPEASTFFDSRNSLTSIQITRRKKKSTSNGPGKWQRTSPKPWFPFLCSCSWPGSTGGGWREEPRQNRNSGNSAHGHVGQHRLPCFMRRL